MRRSIIIAAVFIGSCTLLRFLPAMIGKNYLVEHDQELLGREVQIKDLDINLFSGEVELIGFKIQEAYNASTFIGLDTFYINLKLYKLFSSTLHTDDFLISGLSINITQEDSIFNFTDIINHFESTESVDTVAQDTTTSTLKYSIHNVAMRNCDLRYTDLLKKNTIEMVDLQFSLPQIEWNNATTSADLNFDLGKGGQVSLAGDYNNTNSDFNVKLAIENFNLKITAPYLHDYINFKTLSGLASTKLHVKGNAKSFENITTKGELSVDDFAIKDSARVPLVQFERFHTNIPSYTLNEKALHIDTLLLKNPTIRFDVKDSLHNFSDLVKTNAKDSLVVATVDSPSEEKNSAFSYSVEHLRIINAALDYNDYNYVQSYHYEINKVNLTSDSLSSDIEELNVSIDGKLNDTGYVKAAITINPVNFTEMQVNYSIENFQFHDLSMLSKHYAGYPIHSGSMTYYGNVRLKNDRIYSHHKIKISHLEFGKKEEENALYDIPLRIGIYLMTDANGNIILDLPVNGNINDPDFKIEKIIWGVVKNTIGKVAKTPFKALGGLVAANPDDLKDLTFAFGDTTLSAKSVRTLELLNKVHQKKPNLEFILVQYVDDATEQEVIAFNRCKADYRQANQLAAAKSIQKEDPAFMRYLQTKNDLLGDSTLTTLDLCLKTIDKKSLALQQSAIKARRKAIVENKTQSMNADFKNILKTQNSNSLHEKNVGAPPTFDIHFEMNQ